jgi:hypothetical protein
MMALRGYGSVPWALPANDMDVACRDITLRSTNVVLLRTLKFLFLIKIFRLINHFNPELAERFSESTGLLQALRKTEHRLFRPSL